MAEKLKKLSCFNGDLNPQTTPAAFLFPASKGSGLCSYALVMFLIQTHNLIVKSDHAPINPYKATQDHLAALTRDEVSTLLLAHTTYSIPKDGVTSEEYDIEGIERNIVYRFIKGCPRIVGEIKTVKYLEDRSRSYQRNLSSKIKQEIISANAQVQLETELKLLPDLCSLLENVCTARDFLVEIGGDGQASLVQFMMKLKLYVGEVVNGKNGPLRNLTLGHVDSVIDFLLLIRAKIMTKNDQNPFEQVVPKEFRDTIELTDNEIKELLIKVPHPWLTKSVFSFIWSKLQTEPAPANEDGLHPDWPLDVCLGDFVDDEDSYCQCLPKKLLLKHSVHFFICVNNFVNRSLDN